jgi:hypothetical protein
MKTTHGFKAEKIDRVNEEARGDMELWKVDPPVKYCVYNTRTRKDVEHKTSYVVVSAVVAPFSGSETYIFPADRDGNVIDWGELPGSSRGTMDHKEVIMNINHQKKWS